jgi:diguanylate cyclase (GGDEF)-like protein
MPLHPTLRSLCLLALCTHIGLTSPAFAAEPPEPLIAVMPQYFPPIYTFSHNNVPTGYGAAFMELVAGYTGLNIIYDHADSWPQVWQMFDEGKADIIPNTGITPDRMDYFAFSRPYHEFNLSIFVKRTTQDIKSLNDLQGKRVGVVKGNRGQSLLAPIPGVELIAYSSLGQLAVALRTDEVDAVVYPAVVFENFTINLGIPESFKKVGQPLETVKRAIAVRKELSHLIPLLNQGIEQALASSAHTQIYNRWHPEPSAYWDPRRVLMLIASLLVGFIAIWLAYRYLTTRKFNKKLIRYSNFNDAILNATSDGIITVDSSYRIVAMNTYARALFGGLSSALYGLPVLQLLPGLEFRYRFDRIINDDGPTDISESIASNCFLETRAYKSNKESFPVRVGLARIDANDGIKVVCTIHDESRTHEAENRAEKLLNHDPLTGARNLRGLLEALSAAIDSDARSIYCFCIGLTHMTQINSSYGRHVGDNALVQVANNLALAFNDDKQVLICRSSGNHFMVTITNPLDKLETIAQSITSAIRSIQVVTTDNTSPLTIELALGAAIYPDHANTEFELINHAEIAYAKGKRHTFENFCLYSPELSIEQSEIEAAYQRVKLALNEDRVTLHYQPIQTIHSEKIHHYEALVRMYDEDGTLIMPVDIIPVAEQFNLITQIDYKVMGLVLEQLSRLKQDHPEIAISVNLSAKHIGDAKLYKLIQSDMSRHNIDFANLIFEITETAALQNFAAAREFMNDLIGFGCRFALDDFGVGFTSFAQLRTLPVDIIKIDGMFIKDLHTNTQDQVFVKAMTDVAHSLGKKVVAEFVENEEILKILGEHGVDFAQGYHIGRPDPDIPLDSNLNEGFTKVPDIINPARV